MIKYVCELEHWISERELIRIQRSLNQPPPWTQDPILSKYHFCNVNRQHDRGTIEIQAVAKNVHNVHLLPSAYTMARMFNHAPTVEYVFDRWDPFNDPADDAALAKQVKAELPKVFNTAYVVSTCGKSMDKVEYVFGVTRAVAEIDVPRGSCGSAYKAINSVDGMGTFMAAQVVADLKNDRYLETTPDWKTFVSMGPGSKKGLDFLFGGGTTQGNFKERITMVYDQLPEHLRDIIYSMQDFQNCLCEFSKYMRHRTKAKGRKRYYAFN